MTSPMQVAVAMEFILDFAGQAARPDRLKDDFKNVNGQINVSCLLVFHQLIFIITFTWVQRSSLDATLFMPMLNCLLASPLTHEWLKLLVKLI